MMYYNYPEAVKKDVMEFLREYGHDFDGLTRDELEEKLNDMLWADDAITGNGSGSYTFNSKKAEENICGNWDLIQEINEEWQLDFSKGPEYLDVCIRCFLLPTAISAALDAVEDLGFVILEE